MHITRIEIRNFRNIKHFCQDDLGRAVALFGSNGACKSSVIYALQMALFSHCEYTARNGARADLLVRDGAKQAEIHVTIEGLLVSMTIPRRGKKLWTVMDTSTGELLEDIVEPRGLFFRLGTDVRHAEIAAMPGAYLDSKDVGDLLAEYVGGDIDPEAVLSACGEHAEWVEKLAYEQHNPLSSPADLAQLGDAVYLDRTETNRELKKQKAEQELAGFVPDAKDYQGKTRKVSELPAIRAGVDTLRKDERELYREKGAAETGAADPGELARLDAGLVELSEAASAALERSRAATARRDEAHTEYQSSVDAREIASQAALSCRADKRHADDALAAIDVPDGKCPFCQRKLTDAVLEKLRAPLEIAAIGAAAALDAAEADLDAATGAMSKANENTGTATDAAFARHNQHHEATEQLAIVLSARDALAAKQAKPTRPLETIDAEIADARAKIERGEKLIADLEKVDTRDSLANWIAKLEADAAQLTWAVKAFRDGEVSNKFLASDALDEFVARANAELKVFGAYSLDVLAEKKTIQILLTCPGLSPRPVSHCSQGERLLASFALASAFAGTAPILLDDINDLDARHRKSALMRLKEHEGGSVIVAGAWQQANEDLTAVRAALEPVTVVWLEAGEGVINATA